MELLGLLEAKQINQATAREILNVMLQSGQSAKEIVVQKELNIVSDSSLIQEHIQRVLSDNPREVEQYLSGKETLANWFFGQVMALTKGKADPGVVKQQIEIELENIKRK